MCQQRGCRVVFGQNAIFLVVTKIKLMNDLGAFFDIYYGALMLIIIPTPAPLEKNAPSDTNESHCSEINRLHSGFGNNYIFPTTNYQGVENQIH